MTTTLELDARIKGDIDAKVESGVDPFSIAQPFVAKLQSMMKLSLSGVEQLRMKAIVAGIATKTPNMDLLAALIRAAINTALRGRVSFNDVLATYTAAWIS